MIRAVASLAVLACGFVTGAVSHPPHVAPPEAEAYGIVALAAVGGEIPGDVIAEFGVWIEGVQRAAQEMAAVSAPAVVPVVIPGDCEGFVLPAAIVWRESKCQRLGDSQNGYYGAYQIGALHWGPSGLCSDLSWSVPAEEDECALRLWGDGAGAGHWGT